MARILAKALNARGRARRATSTRRRRVARAIADGIALDVIEMDAASQRGIDDIREIRERALLQPAEGSFKVYILDEAHQLTDAAWNALLKLIEEPPPHLVFVFCTTELHKVLADGPLALPDVRRSSGRGCRSSSRRCGGSCDGEGIDGARRGARADRARRARLVPRRDLDARPARRGDRATQVSVQDVLQLVGAVDEEALVRLCDTVVDRDTAGALVARRGARPSRARTSAGSSTTCSSTSATCCSCSTSATCPTRCR